MFTRYCKITVNVTDFIGGMKAMASASKQEDDAARSAAELKIGFADPAEKPWLLESRFVAAEFAADGKIGGREATQKQHSHIARLR